MSGSCSSFIKPTVPAGGPPSGRRAWAATNGSVYLHRARISGPIPTVRPPRLGGNERIGVFASRSNFRPNPIGLSVVELLGIDGTALRLGGGDFLDGTPVLDIKPYIPYADCIPEATGAYAPDPPAPANEVEFAAGAETAIRALEDVNRPALRRLICDMLSYDPRPAYHPIDPGRIYGTRVFDLEIRWKQTGNVVRVETVAPHSEDFQQ
jgi:hypothetical protein